MTRVRLQEPEDRCTPSPPAGSSRDGRQLEINVIYTDVRGTMAALRAAQYMARDLEAQTQLLVAQVVPLQFPLSSPPVSVAFTERRAYAMAKECQQDGDINIRVYLCGDKRKCLLRILKPQSLVLIGGKKRWWPVAEEKLARFLKDSGHRVIFVNGE